MYSVSLSVWIKVCTFTACFQIYVPEVVVAANTCMCWQNLLRFQLINFSRMIVSATCFLNCGF
jgi:hypothetical protein